MTPMHIVDSGRRRPSHARLTEREDEYVVEFDASDFTERDLTVEVVGSLLTVRGDQIETTEGGTRRFHPQERLEESFRLPEDVETTGISALYEHGTLRIHAPRTGHGRRLVPIGHRSFVVNPDATGC